MKKALVMSVILFIRNEQRNLITKIHQMKNCTLRGMHQDIIHTKSPVHILQSLIDDKLEVVGRHDVLEFKGLTRKMGDHWTILIFDLGRCQWSFYNSMLPRRGDSDQHLIGSLVVVKYVETKLRKVFKKKYCDHVLLKGETKKPESEACLYQYPDSLDCGVVVCHHIENVIIRQPKKTVVFNYKESCRGL